MYFHILCIASCPLHFALLHVLCIHIQDIQDMKNKHTGLCGQTLAGCILVDGSIPHLSKIQASAHDAAMTENSHTYLLDNKENG